MSDWVEIRTVADPDLRAQLEERVRLSVERDRVEAGLPYPVPTRSGLLCGCPVDTDVRADGSCTRCSP